MSFAIVKIAGHQYPVRESQRLVVPRHLGQPGSTVQLDQVALIGEGASVRVGSPTVGGATVEAEVLEHRRGDKVTVGKFKRRRDYHRTRGHRQDETVLRITRIQG